MDWRLWHRWRDIDELRRETKYNRRTREPRRVMLYESDMAPGRLEREAGGQGFEETLVSVMDVNAAILSLPPTQRACLVDRAAGYTLEETALRVGCTPTAVDTHAHRGREKLRRLTA